MARAYCIDGPNEGRFIDNPSYQDFQVEIIPEFDSYGPPYLNQTIELVTYRLHRWEKRQEIINYDLGCGRKVFFCECYIATCSPFGPPDMLTRELTDRMHEVTRSAENLISKGSFMDNFDQWFVECSWRHGLLNEEDWR